jgi:hypothetical protein
VPTLAKPRTPRILKRIVGILITGAKIRRLVVVVVRTLTIRNRPVLIVVRRVVLTGAVLVVALFPHIPTRLVFATARIVFNITTAGDTGKAGVLDNSVCGVLWSRNRGKRCTGLVYTNREYSPKGSFGPFPFKYSPKGVSDPLKYTPN